MNSSIEKALKKVCKMMPRVASTIMKVHEEPKKRKGKTMNENQTVEVIEVTETNDKKPVSRAERITKAVASAGVKVRSALSKVKNEKVATCVAAAGGAAASGAGATAAVIGTTTMVTTAGVSAATITAAGTAIGGTVGALAGAVGGAGVGIATGGVAIAGTIPCAIAGGTTGASLGAATATTVAGWLGVPMATTVAVTTVPVWAIPVAAGGAVVALGAGVAYWIRRKKRLAA